MKPDCIKSSEARPKPKSAPAALWRPIAPRQPQGPQPPDHPPPQFSQEPHQEPQPEPQEPRPPDHPPPPEGPPGLSQSAEQQHPWRRRDQATQASSSHEPPQSDVPMGPTSSASNPLGSLEPSLEELDPVVTLVCLLRKMPGMIWEYWSNGLSTWNISESTHKNRCLVNSIWLRVQKRVFV